MLENYEIIAPNGVAFGKAGSWTEAVDSAVDLSIRWGVLFKVRRLFESLLPFQKERAAVLDASLTYVELHKQWPKAIVTAKAKKRFEDAKHKLDTLVGVYTEVNGQDWADTNLAEPVRAFRADI